MADTIFHELADRAGASPDGVAVLQKRYGLWTATTARSLVARVVATASALRADGIDAHDVVALVLAPHEDRVVIDLALQAIGAVVVGVPSNTPLPRVRSLLEGASPVAAVVQGQAAADGLLELRDRGGLSSIRRMYYVDAAGVQDYAVDELVPLPEVDADEVSDPSGALRELAAALDPDATAVRTATSGSGGPPVPVELSHANLLAAARATIGAFGLDETDRVLSFRPLSDPVERGATVYPALLAGASLVLPESRSSVGQAMVETAPTYLHLTPRFVEGLATDVRLRMQAARGVKGQVLRAWRRTLVADVEAQRTPDPSWASRTVIGRHVLAKLGLDRARWLLVSGSPISPEAVAFYAALGADLRVAHSMAEVGGFSLAATGTASGWAQTMRPVPGIEAEVHDGELVLRGPAVSAGAAPDGSLRTGDAAEETADGLVVDGRHEGRIPTSAGGTVAALRVAAALRSSPYIAEAVVATEPGGTTAVIETAQAPLARWATDRGLRYTTRRTLDELPEVRALVERAARAAASRLDVELAQIRVLASPLSTAEGTLTGTGKPVPDAVRAAEVLGEPTTAGV